MRRYVKRILERFGVRVSRAPWPNRFSDMEGALRLLAQRGYRPELVIDCGANDGQWAALAAPLFPSARFVLVEPQPGCAPQLARFAAPRFTLERVALAPPGVAEVEMVCDAEQRGSGAWVARPGETTEPTIRHPATTLDALLASHRPPHGSLLLKLDLEGYELDALSGGEATLAAADVVVTEVRFYDVDGLGRPTFAQLFDRLRAADFELYDVAMLAGRARDGRLRMGDVIFVRRGSALSADTRAG